MKNHRRYQRSVSALLKNEAGVADVGMAVKMMVMRLAAVHHIVQWLGILMQTQMLLSLNL